MTLPERPHKRIVASHFPELPLPVSSRALYSVRGPHDVKTQSAVWVVDGLAWLGSFNEVLPLAMGWTCGP